VAPVAYARQEPVRQGADLLVDGAGLMGYGGGGQLIGAVVGDDLGYGAAA
jgi:hypothetical protein